MPGVQVLALFSLAQHCRAGSLAIILISQPVDGRFQLNSVTIVLSRRINWFA